MANDFNKPYVNPYPHNGHVDTVQPNTGMHQHIEVRDLAAAQAIRFAILGPPK